jgi:hypothetical protein
MVTITSARLSGTEDPKICNRKLCSKWKAKIAEKGTPTKGGHGSIDGKYARRGITAAFLVAELWQLHLA